MFKSCTRSSINNIHEMSEPVVCISEGSLRGKTKENLNGEPFFSFEGIPYGEPPIGHLRFKAPVPVKAWSGVKDALAKDIGNLAKHHNVFKDPNTKAISAKWILEGSENCLNLNVYTRQLPGGNVKPKAVMVFIHGGAFTMGSTRPYGSEALMTEDIVLVTIHYRLGAFGFLSLENPKLGVTGNCGLKDMVLALKWVKRNISVFNGDPNNVTIFGHSAGGAAVSFLVLSPSASGLFHKAIIQSGAAINQWADGNPENGKLLAKVLGCTKSEDVDILQFLQDLPAEKIYEGQLKLKDNFDTTTLRVFVPLVESKETTDAFLTEEPMKILKSGKYNHVPIMIGYTDMEALLFLLEDKESPLNVYFFEEDTLPPRYLGLTKGSEQFKNVAKKIRKFYYGDEKPELVSLPTIQMGSDLIITRGLIKKALHLVNTSEHPVYLYRFRTPTDNGVEFSSKKLTGVLHGGELKHLFKMISEPKHISSCEEVLRKQLIRMWTNFAKYGNPTPAKDELITVEWKAMTKDRRNFLDIADDLTVDVDPEKEMMAFWDDLLLSYPHARDY